MAMNLFAVLRDLERVEEEEGINLEAETSEAETSEAETSEAEVKISEDEEVPSLVGESMAASLVRGIATEPHTLVVDEDPRVSVDVNNAHRRADVPDGEGSDLYTLEQVSRLMPCQYKFPVQTFAPRHWPAACAISQKDYRSEIAKTCPEILEILPMKHVVIAGGFAADPKTADDVDFFIYGIDPADRITLWDTVNKLVVKLRTVLTERDRVESISEFMAKGCITLTANSSTRFVRRRDRHRPTVRKFGEPIQKFQIILRAYPSVSAILHGFDAPSCSVATDSVTTVTTTLGAYAMLYRVNVVVPAYRSTTYEKRLKKYFDRNRFALALPDFKQGLLRQGETWALPHIELKASAARGYFAAGALNLVDEDKIPESDYTPDMNNYSSWDVESVVAFGGNSVNTWRIINGDSAIISKVYTHDGQGRNSRYRRRHNRGLAGIPFHKFGKEEPTLESIITREQMRKTLQKSANSVVQSNGALYTSKLRYLFKMTELQITQFVDIIDGMAKRFPNRRILPRKALEPFVGRLLAKYDEMSPNPEWWFVTDPGRQYTSSNDPRMEDPATWYGDAYDPEKKIQTAEDYLESILATMEARQGTMSEKPVFDGQCSLCHEAALRGDNNTTILPCGHIFHFSDTEACPGLRGWITEHDDCPMCRQEYNARERRGSNSSDGPLDVEINWEFNNAEPLVEVQKSS